MPHNIYDYGVAWSRWGSKGYQITVQPGVEDPQKGVWVENGVQECQDLVSWAKEQAQAQDPEHREAIVLCQGNTEESLGATNGELAPAILMYGAAPDSGTLLFARSDPDHAGAVSGAEARLPEQGEEDVLYRLLLVRRRHVAAHLLY